MNEKDVQIRYGEKTYITYNNKHFAYKNGHMLNLGVEKKKKKLEESKVLFFYQKTDGEWIVSKLI